MLPAIAVYLSWLLFIGGVLTGSFRPIGAFFGIFATTFIWNLLLMIIDYATYITIVSQLSGILGSTNAQFAFDTQDLVSGKIDKALAFLGYMSLATFGLATTMVGKMSILADKTVSGAITQMQPGMHTLSASAKGGNSFGYTSTTEGATSSIKEVFDKEGNRRYVQETYNADGSRETKDLTGVGETYSTTGNGYKTTGAIVNGVNAQKYTSPDGSEYTISNGKVVGVTTNNGVTATMTDVSSQVINDGIAKSALETKARSSDLSNARTQLDQAQLNLIKSAGLDKNKDTKEAVDKSIDEAYVKTLKKAYEDGTITKDQLAIGLDADLRQQLQGFVRIESEVGTPFKALLGSGMKGTTGGMATTTFSFGGKAGFNFGIDQSHADKLAEAFDKNFKESLKTNIQNSDSLSSKKGDNGASAFMDSYSKAQVATDKYNEARNAQDAWTSTKNYMGQHASQFGQDILTLHMNTLKEQGYDSDALQREHYKISTDANYAKNVLGGYAVDITNDIYSKIQEQTNNINNNGLIGVANQNVGVVKTINDGKVDFFGGHFDEAVRQQQQTNLNNLNSSLQIFGQDPTNFRPEQTKDLTVAQTLKPINNFKSFVVEKVKDIPEKLEKQFKDARNDRDKKNVYDYFKKPH